MITVDLKARFRNKAFIVAFVSAIVLLLQQMGLKNYIPDNWNSILNTMLTILTMLGIVVETSTPGISDQVVANNRILQDTNTKKEVKIEDSTISVNNEVSEDSQGASTEEAADTNTNVNSNIPR